MPFVRTGGIGWSNTKFLLARQAEQDASVIVPPMRKISCWPEGRRQEALYNTIKNPVKH